MDTKINYYDQSIETISSFKEGEKPSLLMHVCCGPCSCFPISFLTPHFDLTLCYYNPNIYPHEEFKKRLENLEKLLTNYEKESGYHVNLITIDAEHDDFMEDLEPLKDEREGGRRCHLCYEKRMRKVYDYAEEHHYEYFCTVMTISRQKDSQILNQIGAMLEKEHAKTKYLYSDFKKKDGALKGDQICKRYDLYRQLYCGCEYSYQNMLEREDSQNKN